MKACTKCRVVKDADAFASSKVTKDKLQSWCRECSNAHIRERRKDDLDYKARRRLARVTESAKATRKAYNRTDKGREVVRNARKKRRASKHVRQAERVFFKLRKSGHCPKWSKLSDVIDFYKAAEELKGVFEVDHIIPLNGVDVCGLHVPSNLQLLLPEVNRLKGNTLDFHVKGIVPASIAIPY